ETVTSLLDDKLGNLLSAFTIANSGSAVLAPGASITFTASQTLPVGNASATYVNHVTVNAHDDENDPATASTSATVTYSDVRPTITITKTANPTTVKEGGVGNQAVTYTYTIPIPCPTRSDPETVTSLIDDKLGNLLSA